MAAILTYDITYQKSFEEMENYWYEQIKLYCNKDIVLAVVANKSDLYEQGQVEYDAGEKFAKEIGAIFVSTSAKNDIGIQELFKNISRKIFDTDFDFSPPEQKKRDDFKNKKEEDTKQVVNKIIILGEPDVGKKSIETCIINRNFEPGKQSLKDKFNRKTIEFFKWKIHHF